MLRFAVICAFCAVASAASADPRSALIERYFDLFRMDEVFEILKSEGVQSGTELAENDEAITVSPAWIARLERIYATDKMEAVFRAALRDMETLDGSEEALDFFDTDLGRQIVDIELVARRALMDDAVEEAAREKVEVMKSDAPERLELYREFVAANDLIESNVMGALNSNLAFYRGLASNEIYGEAMSEGFMLESVWQQEPEIRADMEDWTINFSSLAYDTLSDEDVQTYIDVSEAPSGQRMNSALFAGFDAVFEFQSFELGRAMAEFLVGEDT